MVIKEQTDIQNLLATSRRVLVVAKKNPGLDEVGSALAIFDWVRHQSKERVDICFDAPNKNKFKFLPHAGEIRDEIQAADEFIIHIDVAKTKAKELSYDLKGTRLEIKVIPEGGNFTPEDVSFAESTFSYDLIITVGASELTTLGAVFEKNRDLFFHTPIINIDRQVRNLRFGKVNVVYLASTSLAEITHAIIDTKVDADSATCLLAGLIAATNSFQTPQVTPQTLQLASELIVAGAKREEIVDHLYRTKDMDRLKIWGRVLTRLQKLDGRIVYSDLTKEDLEGKDVDLQSLVDDLVLASPEADIVLFFFEDEYETMVYAYARENFDLPQLLRQYSPTGTRREAILKLQKSRIDAEQEITAHLRNELKLINR